MGGGGERVGCIMRGSHNPQVLIRVAIVPSCPLVDMGLSRVKSKGQYAPVSDLILSLASMERIIKHPALL